MRAKRETPVAQPRLEPLEQRLVPAATLEPIADNPESYTLKIDLSQHPRGGDGQPDTLYVTRAGGVLDVTLVGREPAVIFHGESAQIAGVELLGSSDVEYVLVQDVFDPPLTFTRGDGDQLIQIGEAIAVPDEWIDNPEIATSYDPTIAFRNDAVPPPGVEMFSAVVLPSLADSMDVVFPGGGVFLAPTEPLPSPAAQGAEEDDEQPSVPPELLGGKPTEEELDIRKLLGGSHRDGPHGLAGAAGTAEEEEVEVEEEEVDPEA